MKISRMPRRVHGVDFSGAVNAGDAIWIAGGAVTSRGLELEDCRPASRLPGGTRARDGALAALRNWIAAQGEAAIGLDFPFGLPWPLSRGYNNWEAFVRAFPSRHLSAEAFRAHCRVRAGGRELRRETDLVARTPFSPYNLRMYRQTWHGIRQVLAPLVAAEAVCVPPMQTLRPDRPWLLEICPASTLKRMGLYRPYKGKTRPHRAMRREILAHLQAAAGLRLPAALRGVILADRGGDALDSVIAAVTARLLLRGASAALFPALPPSVARKAALEAWVYVPDGPQPP